jgi:hypothetical protein
MLLVRNLTFACLAASAALGACATDSRTPEGMSPEIDSKQPSSYIRSADELQVHLQAAASSPLDRLAPAARQHFIDSLVFTELGLASWDYSDLRTLPAADEARILGLFRPKSSAAAAVVSPHETLEGYVCKPSSGGCVALDFHACETTTCRQP